MMLKRTTAIVLLSMLQVPGALAAYVRHTIGTRRAYSDRRL